MTERIAKLSSESIAQAAGCRKFLRLVSVLGRLGGAERAGQFVADMIVASLRSGDPVATGPGRIVADMLLMAAFEVGNPVEAVVLMKADDSTRGSGDFCLHGFHVPAALSLRSLPPARWPTGNSCCSNGLKQKLDCVGVTEVGDAIEKAVRFFPAAASGLVNAGTRTYDRHMLKRDLPVTHCTICGSAGYNSRVTGGRCCRTIGGERCNGMNAGAANRSDWEDCSNCGATGYYRNKDCPQCQGVGYLYLRPREKQAVV